MHELFGLTPDGSSPGEATPARVKSVTKTVLRMLRTLHTGRTFDKGAVNLVVWQAYRSADDEYGEKEALVWGAGYRIPSGLKDRDVTALQSAGGSLPTLVSNTHAEMTRKGRLDLTRVANLVGEDDPDKQRLEGLVDGIPIFAAEGFRPNGKPDTLRRKYVRMAPVVDRLMSELHSKGFIFILPTSEVIKFPGVHFSQSHWAVKKGKVWGRPIGDASASSRGEHALNSDRTKELADEVWGKIEHPTLQDLCRMVKECADREGVGWDSLVLWKMDLRGAFHLLFIHPDSAQRLAFALGKDTEGVDLSVVFHTGIFGWTGMPGAFQVVTRVIFRLVNARIWGKAMMYVDDLMGVSDLGHILSDLQAARDVCTGLLG